jgi:hypothetical protein
MYFKGMGKLVQKWEAERIEKKNEDAFNQAFDEIFDDSGCFPKGQWLDLGPFCGFGNPSNQAPPGDLGAKALGTRLGRGAFGVCRRIQRPPRSLALLFLEPNLLDRSARGGYRFLGGIGGGFLSDSHVLFSRRTPGNGMDAGHFVGDGWSVVG